MTRTRHIQAMHDRLQVSARNGTDILYIIMKSDLVPLSDSNQIFKYADDTTLLVPENSDVDLADEFNHIKGWLHVIAWRLM